uniref:Uncharacterized protein n=1 Tax=Oryza glumipatula TaxID=40148 RepID=A0A0E0ATY8_9ORYZ
MTWTRLLVLPASMTTPYPWGRRRGERDRRRRRRSARADAAARRRRPRPPREPIMEEMEANGSKYQQQKLGDVPSSQPHHLNPADRPQAGDCGGAPVRLGLLSSSSAAAASVPSPTSSPQSTAAPPTTRASSTPSTLS